MHKCGNVQMIKINISLEAMSWPETLRHSKPQKSNKIKLIPDFNTYSTQNTGRV